MNKPGNIDTSFTPHCPNCGGTSWQFTDSDDSRACANSACGALHWFRNAPADEPTKTGRITYTETVEDYLAAEKRKRVRALVFSLIASPWYRDSPVEENVVTAAIDIDNQIESIK